jgi:hypothetical protein
LIEYHNRVLCVGRTRSGKSEWLNCTASQLRGQWALVDPKDEFHIPDVEKITDPDQLDWQNERILHWVPGHDRDEWEAFYARAFALPGGRFTAVVHEAGFSCAFKPNTVGPMHNTYLSQGEAKGLGAWYATQRPVCLPTFATSEPGHVIAFAEKMTRNDDHRTLAHAMDLSPEDLADTQQVLVVQNGPQGFLHFDRGASEITAYRPLPDSLRAGNIVQRTTVE